MIHKIWFYLVNARSAAYFLKQIVRIHAVCGPLLGMFAESWG